MLRNFMRYFGAYRFLFESPKWVNHLLIGAVCQFIPIVGQLVLMGYVYSVIEAKHRHGQDQFPDFDFNQLGAYLVRGVWPFLVSLVAALPVILLTGAGILVFVLSGVAADRADDPPILMIAIMMVGIPVFVLLILGLQAVLLPMTLRAGLSQDFGSAFSMTFIRDFVGRVWKELLLSMLFLIISAPFVVLAGLLMLFVGVYAAAVVLVFAKIHLQYQLYELYLQRGGTPFPLKSA